jgi:hypothetical protein
MLSSFRRCLSEQSSRNALKTDCEISQPHAAQCARFFRLSLKKQAFLDLESVQIPADRGIVATQFRLYWP